MHDSFTPLGGMIPLINMQLGEIIIGGVGAGLYGMLIFVVITIFVAGLMVGRTPEYVGKKIEAKEVKMAMLAILVLPLMYLGWTAVATVLPSAVASIANPGPHGFSEILYLFTSSTGNNGSAFGGITGNTPFYNTTGAVAMFVGRFFMIIPAMAIAGSLAAKKTLPASAGTFPTHGGLFIGLLVGVILIVGGLTFFPALALGPIVEQLAMTRWTAVLSALTGVASMETSQLRKRMPVTSLTDPKIVWPAIGSAFAKLDPRLMMKNPVMFVVEVVAALTTVIFIRDWVSGGEHLLFTFQIIVWLWFTVLFANFAEAVAEGRGKAQAATLRQTREETMAKLIVDAKQGLIVPTPAGKLGVGQIVLVEAGDLIPSDGEVIEGIASVNEAAITGESAPVIRESGGDRSAVTGGTLVVSDWLKVRITAAQGSTFLDRMIALVEGAERQKTPNEIALNILLAGMTIIFVFATATIPSFAAYAGGTISVVVLVALFVTLIPDHDRRAPVRNRHRRHGSAGALQCARHVGPGGRGRRRRRHPAARQDRHHHARQSSGGRVQARLRRQRAGAGRRGAARLACRRDAGGTLHRRARQGEIRHSRPRHPRARRQVHSVHGAEPDERRRDRNLLGPQGCSRCDPRLSQDFAPKAVAAGAAGRKAGVSAELMREVNALAETHRQIGRHAARRRQGRPAARRHSPQGYRQGRHSRALHRASPHGHSHRHDHRRQSHDRGCHRR